MRRYNEQPQPAADGKFKAVVLDLDQDGWPEVASQDGLATMYEARCRSQGLRVNLELEDLKRGQAI